MTMVNNKSVIGTPLDRVDGVAKVTGQARYAGEYPKDGLLHGSVVSSTIARGRVLRIDATEALGVPALSRCSTMGTVRIFPVMTMTTATPMQLRARPFGPCSTIECCIA